MNIGAEGGNGHREDGSVALGNFAKARDGRVLEDLKGDAMNFGDFVGVRGKAGVCVRPDDDRCDQKARSRGVIVEQPDYGFGRQGEPHLLLGLSQCGLDRAFARIHATARERPLARMVPHPRSPAGQYEAGFVPFVAEQEQGNRRWNQAGITQGQALKSVEIGYYAAAKAVVHVEPRSRHGLSITRRRLPGSRPIPRGVIQMVAERTILVPDDVVRRRIPLEGRGVEIAVQDWGGNGPLALLHHANGFCAALWAPVAEKLRDRFRVVAMDARGHGDSSLPAEGAVAEAFHWGTMAGDVVAVAETLLKESGDAQIGLGLGHSFGGTLTLAAEGVRPGLYRRIVLADPVVPPTPEMLAKADWGDRPPLAELARRRRNLWPSREEARAKLGGKPLFASWTPRALDLYIGEALRDREDGQVELKCAREVEGLIFEASLSIDLFERVSAVAAPSLFLWAQHGNFPRPVYQDLCEQMAEARIVDADAGHLIPMEKPDWVAQQALDFCAPD